MKIIGLCGGSGSGKGAVSLLFAKYGFATIDTDEVYHSLTSSYGPCLRELAGRFGERIVNDGRLDRKILREIVFSGPDRVEKQNDLNRITHGYVIAEVNEILKKNARDGACATVIDAPMLFESGLNASCDAVVAVVANDNVRIARIMLRDGITYDDALRRISAQKPNDFLIANSDYVIYNDSDMKSLERAVAQTVRLILN